MALGFWLWDLLGGTMKRVAVVVIAMLVAVMVCGCGQATQKAPEQWTVTFVDEKGEIIEEATVDASEDGAVVECPADVTKEGYALTNWKADSDDAKVEGSRGKAFSVTVYSDGVTLEPVWEKLKQWTVTFTDGEGNAIDTVQVYDGEEAKAPKTPTKDGFVFAGWSAKTDSVTEDMTIDATWKPVWTVTFTDGNGNTLSTVQVEDGKAAKAPASPKLDGYDFSGCNADYSKVTDNITVNAVWKIRPTAGMNNALRSAKSYLSTMPFSYTGLIEQLQYEKYSYEEAVYAADNCGANWSEQAAKSAKQYLNLMPFSRDGLIEQLQYEGYTYDEAVYGVDQAGL